MGILIITRWFIRHFVGGTVLTDYHPWVVEANLADIHGWGLLEIRPGRVDHLNVVHLVPCTRSTCRAAAITQLLSRFHAMITTNHIDQKSIRAEIIQVVPCSANNTGERKGHLLLMLLLQEKRKRSIDTSIGRRKKNKDSRRNMQCGAEAL